MKKILFLIHDLGQGGAEKVLVNLVNHLDRSKFDISITVLFGGGVNEQFLAPDIHFNVVFPKKLPGNSKLMKLLTPEQLHQLCVKEYYDIEISYLEGTSARVISGCRNPSIKLVGWIHVEQHTMKALAASFRSVREAKKCYGRFNQMICVSEFVKNDFYSILDYRKPCDVLYNTVESEAILYKSREPAPELKSDGEIKLIAVGTLKKSKGYDRLLCIIKKLREKKYPICLYILGSGPLQNSLERYVQENDLEKSVCFLGYQTNPYKYMAKCDLFVCASHAEGFSTATTEALILGVPVCTVEVSGMREMLGESVYGLITDNSEEALYRGIKSLLDAPEILFNYKKQAQVRGRSFSTKETVKAVEKMLVSV